MGAAAVSVWTACLKDLEQLATEPLHSAAAELVLERVIRGCDSLHKLPALPRATWKKVVVELKVPLRLFSACSKAAEAQPKSTLVIGATVAVYTILQASDNFLRGATGSANSIRAKVQQQLQQSGLLQQLPALLTAAADELDKRANQGSVRQDGSSSSSRSTSPTISGCPSYRRFIWLHTPHLLETYWGTIVLWRGLHAVKFANAAAGAPAAVHLALAAMHYVDSKVRAVPQTEQRPPAGAAALQQMLLAAHTRISGLASAMGQAMSPPNVLSESPEVNWKRLFQSPHSLPCLALMVSVRATSLLSTPGAGAASSVSTTSTSSSSSAASGSSNSRCDCRREPNQHSLQQRLDAHNQDSPTADSEVKAMQAWQQARAKLPHLTASHHRLFELLGVDSRTAVWTAAAPDESAASLLNVLQAYTIFIEEWQQFHHMWQGVDPQVHLLLPAIVLQCVAGLPADRNARCCLSAFSILSVSTVCWKSVMQPSNAVPAVADCRAKVQPQQQLDILAQQRARQQEVQEVLLPAAFVNEVLPHIFRLYSQLQASIHSEAAVGAGFAQRSSAFAGEDTPTGHGNQGLSTTDEKLEALKGVVISLYLLFHELSHTSGTPAVPVQPVTGMETTAAVAAASQKMQEDQHLHAATEVDFYLAAFQHHALQMMACLEGVARRTAAAPPASRTGRDMLSLGSISRMCHADVPDDDSQGPLLIMARAAGPGSAEQRQLYSLLSSMLKLRHCSTEGLQSVTNRCRMAAADAAVTLLSQQAGGSTAAAVSDTAVKAVHAGLSDLLPSLFIFGCCCLQWAEQLRQEIPSQLLQSQADAGQQSASEAASSAFLKVFSGEAETLDTYSASEMCFHLEFFDDDYDGLTSMLLCWLRALDSWLRDSNTSAQLASAGYDLKQLLQQLTALAAALHTAIGNEADDAQLLDLVQQLHDLGVALSSVATPHACNNPNCSNVSGPSELQLVSGRSSMCAGCRTARYCSKACQKQHWKQHKPACKALAAAAAVTRSAST